jgi:hypothetical protein
MRKLSTNWLPNRNVLSRELNLNNPSETSPPLSYGKFLTIILRETLSAEKKDSALDDELNCIVKCIYWCN